MEKYVIKRNGEYKPLEEYKITEAIRKGFESVGTDYDETIITNVLLALNSKEVWSVEEIQDVIEKALFKADFFEVLRSFMVHEKCNVKIQTDSPKTQLL